MSVTNILDKIRKLLAMAKDASSPNEAAIAAKQARALMDKHQVSEMDISMTPSQFGEDYAEFGNKTAIKWLGKMALGVARLNDTRCIWEYRNGQKAIRFQGYLEDVSVSVLMMVYLRDTAMRLGQQETGRTARTDFRMGFAVGVCQQIDEMLKERQEVRLSDGRALVVVKSAAVSAEFGDQRTRRANGSRQSGSFFSGIEAGRKVSLNRQVSGSKATAYLQ